MRAEIFGINDFLAIMPRPRGNEGLEDEIISLKSFGVKAIVSLLEPGEIIELELDMEPVFCERNEIIFLNFPIADRQVPASFEETLTLVKKLSDFIDAGKKVAIHCRQGVGRSSLIAACVLVFQGASSKNVFERIAKARSCQVPDTNEQIDWVALFANKFQ